MLIVSMVPSGTAIAQDEDDGLRLEVDASYVVRPVERDVSVTLEVEATNTLDDAEDDFGVTRFYFDEIGFAIPVEATEITVADEIGELQVSTADREDEGIAEATIALRSRLYSGQTRRLTVRFVIPASPLRSDGDVSIDQSHAWFFLWAYGDPGLSTVSAKIPPDFDVDVIGDSLTRTFEEGELRLVSGPVGDPPAWVALISARNDDALDRRKIELGEGAIEIRSWPSDPEWARELVMIVQEQVPRLGALLGRPWESEFVITQAIDPAIGRHTGGPASIEMGEDLDRHTVLHELAHGWIDRSLFAERWITEGLADAVAAAVGSEEGGHAAPKPVERADPGAIPLNRWHHVGFEAERSDETQRYASSASWQLVSTIVDEIGIDRMRGVLEAAWADTTAYRGDVTLDFVPARDDWRRFLDLLEEVGGSTRAADLFETWVVEDDQRGLLQDRAEARAAYALLDRRAGNWALPVDLRRAMSDWDFELARDEIAVADRVIEARDAVLAITERAGLSPESLESRFEAGADGVVLVAELEAQSAVAIDVLEAVRAVQADRAPFERFGLLGTDLASELGEARRAFAEGSLAESRTSALAIVDVISRAEQRGRDRASLAFAALLLGSGVAIVIRRGNRRRRSSTSLRRARTRPSAEVRR